jgi:signal transduction histidine kinase
MQATKSDRFKGIGLGLSISKAIVTAHGGKISAYNNSLGATFEFTIPCSKKMHKKGDESLKLDNMLK